MEATGDWWLIKMYLSFFLCRANIGHYWTFEGLNDRYYLNWGVEFTSTAHRQDLRKVVVCLTVPMALIFIQKVKRYCTDLNQTNQQISGCRVRYVRVCLQHAVPDAAWVFSFFRLVSNIFCFQFFIKFITWYRNITRLLKYT